MLKVSEFNPEKIKFIRESVICSPFTDNNNLLSLYYYEQASNRDVVILVFSELGIGILNKIKMKLMQLKDNGFSFKLRTHDEMLTSADIMPADYLQWQNAACCIFGKNDLAEIKVDDSNLRLTLEFRVRQLTSRFRKIYLKHGNEIEVMKQLIRHVIREHFEFFKLLLFLEGKLKDISISNRKLSPIIESEYQLPHEFFRRMLYDTVSTDQQVLEKLNELLEAHYKLQKFTDRLRI